MQQPAGIGDDYGILFERTLLWVILNDNAFADSVYATIKPQAFTLQDHGTIYNIGQGLYVAAGKKPTKSMPVWAELIRQTRHTPNTTARGKILEAALAYAKKHLMGHSTFSASDVTYVKESLQKWSTRNAVRDALMRSAQLWEQGKFDEVHAIVEAAVHSPQRSLSEDLGISWNNARSKIQTYMTCARNPALNAPIGIPIMDNAMRGGLEPGTLGIVIGSPGRGKSLFAVQAGTTALAKGLNVALASFELRQRDYSMRFDARMTAIPINELAKNLGPHIQDIIKATKQSIGQLHIRHWAPRTASVDDLRVWLKALNARDGFHPDVIFIDYADLLRIDRQLRDAPDVGDAVMQLRQLADEFNSRVWTASQIQRGAYDKAILSMANVAEDIQKVNIADVIIGLCQTPQERARKFLRLALLKNRLGGNEGLLVDCEVQTETMLLRERSTQSPTAMRGMSC